MKTLFFPSLLDIDFSTLDNMNIRCVLLDVDNTIKPYGADVIQPAYIEWIKSIKDKNIKVILCSNNYKRVVEPIAKQVNCDFVSFCLKPSPFGYLRAYVKSNEKLKNIVVIGDQFFTDILGGKFMFMKTLLVEPVSSESEGTTVILRRKLTAVFVNKIKNRYNPYLKRK